MKVLVTGGGGFLGSAVCRQLAAAGHEVVAFQRSPADHLTSYGVEFQCGDITDEAALKKAAQGCEAVIHTAGKAGVWGNRKDYISINVHGTSLVIKTCRDLGIPHLVHTSSPSIVHAGGDIEGGDESLPIADHFSAPYPESKALAEKIVTASNREGLQTVALRPHLIWGPGDPHILPRLAAKVRGGKLAIPGASKVIDTVYVENAAQAHVMALDELTTTARCAGKAYFVTNNEPLPQGEIIQRLLAAIGMDVKIRSLPGPVAMVAGTLCEFSWKLLPLSGEPPATRFAVEQLGTAHWFDTSAATRDFGYEPEITIEQGLVELAAAGL